MMNRLRIARSLMPRARGGRRPAIKRCDAMDGPGSKARGSAEADPCSA